MHSPFRAHRPATDNNSLIGCTSHNLTDDWSQPMPISLCVWVRSFIEPDLLNRCTVLYRSTIPLQFI